MNLIILNIFMYDFTSRKFTKKLIPHLIQLKIPFI